MGRVEHIGRATLYLGDCRDILPTLADGACDGSADAARRLELGHHVPGGPLEPGTVITVEPGIYIPAADDIDRRWWNIGVRIEDDVLITDGEPLVLSADAPRTADAIESLMQDPTS